MEGGGERDKQRDRETDLWTDGQTKAERDKKIERGKNRDEETKRHINRYKRDRDRVERRRSLLLLYRILQKWPLKLLIKINQSLNV